MTAIAEWLAHAVTDLRSVVLALCVLNLIWLAPAFRCAIKGDASPDTAMRIGMAGITLGLASLQSAYLFEGTPDPGHWRIAVSLMLLLLGLAILPIARWRRQVERRLTGEDRR